MKNIETINQPTDLIGARQELASLIIMAGAGFLQVAERNVLSMTLEEMELETNQIYDFIEVFTDEYDIGLTEMTLEQTVCDCIVADIIKVASTVMPNEQPKVEEHMMSSDMYKVIHADFSRMGMIITDVKPIPTQQGYFKVTALNNLGEELMIIARPAFH